jgi:hypothetical protein
MTGIAGVDLQRVGRIKPEGAAVPSSVPPRTFRKSLVWC